MIGRRLPLFILAGVLLVTFYRLLTGEVFFWGLPALQFYPWREYAFEQLRSGYLPLWNMYNGAGAPLLANYQSGLLYPLNWFGLILPLAWSMSVTAVLHLFIAGWGMWMLSGRLGVSELGRGVSVLAFGLTSYTLARLGTYPIILAAAWMPWIIWATLGILTSGERRSLAWLALFAGLQLLAGHAQTAWYSMLLTVAFTVWWSITHRPVNGYRLLSVLGGLALAAGLAAAQLIPTGELLLQSQRSGGVDFDFAMNYSYAPLRTLNLLSPNFFGNPGDGTYATKGAFFEDAVYIGLIPLISALAAVIRWAWSKIRRSELPPAFGSASFWLLVVVIAFVFALGKNTPIFPFLYRNIPTFSLFQAPVRWHLWTVFGLSILAGMGVSAWGRGYWLLFGTRLATAGSIGGALLAVAATRFLPPETLNTEGVQVLIRAVIATGIFGALAGVLTLTQPETPTDRWYAAWSLAVLVILGADLGYAAQGLNPTLSASFFDRTAEGNPSVQRAYWPKEAEKSLEFDELLTFDDYRVAVNRQDEFRRANLANLNLLDRTPLLNNFEPLLVGNFAQYLDLIEENPSQRDRLLQAAGVDAVYDAQGKLSLLDQKAARAWFVRSLCGGVLLPDSNILSSDWLPTEQAFLFPVQSGDECQEVSSSPGEVLSIHDQGNSTILNVQTEQDGVLILADTFYPGWASQIDGKTVEIQRANLNFRAVYVPAGSQTVRFDYQPAWLWPSVLVSIVSMLIMLVLFRSRNPERN